MEKVSETSDEDHKNSKRIKGEAECQSLMKGLPKIADDVVISPHCPQQQRRGTCQY